MKPKQLIWFERGKLVYDGDLLENTLKKIGTSNVALISATGSARSGKSYLLNHVRRFFCWEKDDDEDWMGWATPYTELEGFNWRGGKDAVTSGIWIWPEPLMAETNDGELVGILLLDTQGTLNEFTTQDESITITALCFLLSSMTIYNVKNEIEHESFQLIKKSLQLCSQLPQGTFNIRDVMFTVRDYRKENGFDYGMENGKQYIEEKLAVKPGLTEDAKLYRELIKSSFKGISCSLFPDPGVKVRDISHKGCLAEVDTLFLTVLEEIPSIFNADTLHRNSFGNSVEFMNLFQSCINFLNEHEEKDFQQQNNSTDLQAFNMYKEMIEKHPDEFFSAEDVNVVHTETLKICNQFLENENGNAPHRVMLEIQSRFHKMVDDYYQQVITKSEEKGKELQNVIAKSVNAIKDTYTDDIGRKLFSKTTVSETEILLKNSLIKDECLFSFKECIPKKYQHLNFGPQVKILENQIDEIFNEKKMIWEARKKEYMISNWTVSRPAALEEYKNRMKKLLGGHTFLYQNILQDCHERCQKTVLDNYCSISEYGDLAIEFQTEVKQNLNQILLEFERTNNEKMIEFIEGKLEKCLAIAIVNYSQDLEAIEQDIELTEENFIHQNEEARNKIKSQFLTEIGEEPEDIKAEFSSKLDNELKRKTKEAMDKFQSARSQYSAIVEENKSKIQAEMLNILEKHGNSNDILTEGKTEELGKNLIERTKLKFDTLRSHKNLPSIMLDDAQLKTIDQIEIKVKNMELNREKRIAELKRNMHTLVDDCFVIYKFKIEKLEKIDSEELLGQFHAELLEHCVQDLKNKCVIKDDSWLHPFIKSLEENIEKYYKSDVKKVFMFELEQKNLQLTTATFEATKLYREAMDDYFKEKPFTIPSDLLAYHSKLCTKISNTVARKCKLGIDQKAKLFHCIDKEYLTYETINKSNTPTDDPAIGIDLGTTYTCVAIYENGNTRVIPNEKGSSTFPSYVAFTPTGELVGHPAKEMAHVYPENTIFDAKRLIGRRFDEKTVQSDIKNWPFEVIDENNIPKIKVQLNNGPKNYPPEKISAKILHHVKVIAEKDLGKKIKKAVITVPAYFNEGQRQATKDAGEIAGLDVLQIINEPTAAAMAYHLNTRGVRYERNVLVYDLGGGTFDVAVLNMKPGGEIVVKSVGGDTHLGGEDFDDNLLEEVVKTYKKKNGIDLKAGKYSKKVDKKANAARILRRLRNACEMAKINISGGDNTKGVVNVAALVGETDLLEPITRKEFEHLNMHLFLKTLNVVRKALEDSELEKGDIHDIVLVGGSTRIPIVQKLLSDYFDGKVLRATVHPDEAVARGAAIQAAILNGNQEQILKNISLKDVTPLSLGVETVGDNFSTVIKRNSPLPANETRNYCTTIDYQDAVLFSIYEGEEKTATDNHLLGKFRLTDIPKKKKGEEKLLVTMELDTEGILKVNAVCVSTGARENITIEDHRGRLTTAEKQTLKMEFFEE